ncbi:MAG: ATP-binding protein [Alphaproteobacteria bacterium]
MRFLRLFRLGFTARVTLILLASLVAIQILMVVAFFMQRSHNTGSGFRLPLPDQVAAIAEIMEQTPADQRESILRALNGARFHTRVTTEKLPPPPKTWRKLTQVERVLKRYLKSLGDREVTVLLQTEHGRLFEGFRPSSVVTVIVGLKTGEKLVIEVTGPFAVIFGFPPGFWAGVIGFLVTILAFLIIRRESRPLRSLAEAANKIDLSDPLPIADSPSSAPEIRAVIAAFNGMQERITGLIKSRMEMVGSFSHDVRTYATRLRLRAELIPDEAEKTRAIRDIEDMISVVNDALLALQDRPEMAADELVDVGELVSEEIEEQRRVGATASLALPISSGSALVLGSGTGLRRVFHNLIQNAVLYGGDVQASVEVSGESIRVLIEDSGPGIPHEWRARVVQPFVRLEGSRNRKTGGAGLGLAIAGKIVEGHGGRLAIDDAPGGGARITVELPLFEVEAEESRELDA